MSSTSLQSLSGGGTHNVYARSGDRIICLEGWVTVGEPRAGAGARCGDVAAALRAGETHYFHEGGVVSLRAEQDCRIIYLRAQPVLWPYVLRALQHIQKWCMIRFIRRGVEQSGSSSGS